MSPSLSGLSRPFRFLGRYPMRSPTTPAAPRRRRFGLLPFRSPLLRESTFLSFPPGTEMFQFPGFAHLLGVTGLQPAGLPHSDTRGSSHACRSPRFFAACRVLLRFRKPRHPPSAISNFFCESNDFRLAFVKLYLKRPISYASCFNLVRFSLIIVNELAFRTVFSQTGCKDTDFFITSKFFCNIFCIFLGFLLPLFRNPLTFNN